MNEEERKEQHKAVRIISNIALIVGITTFLLGILLVPYTRLTVIYPSNVEPKPDAIWIFLIAAGLSSIKSFWFFTIIGMILSVVTFNIERDTCRRVLPLAFVLIGFLIYAVCYSFLQ